MPRMILMMISEQAETKTMPKESYMQVGLEEGIVDNHIHANGHGIPIGQEQTCDVRYKRSASVSLPVYHSCKNICAVM